MWCGGKLRYASDCETTLSAGLCIVFGEHAKKFLLLAKKLAQSKQDRGLAKLAFPEPEVFMV